MVLLLHALQLLHVCPVSISYQILTISHFHAEEMEREDHSEFLPCLEDCFCYSHSVQTRNPEEGMILLQQQ